MSEQFEGDPNIYPADYPIPDGSDPPTAAAVNPALEALGHRTEFLRTHGRELVQLVYSSPVPNYWTCPDGVTWIWVFVLGGGGGGGKGTTATGTDQYPSGGGGGGAALGSWHLRAVTPGEQYYVYPAAGGAGAASLVQGGAGGDSIFADNPGGENSVIGYGASGGRSGAVGNSGLGGCALGGGVAHALRYPWSSETPLKFPYPMVQPGDGGWAATGNLTFLGDPVLAGRSARGALAAIQSETGFANEQSRGGSKGTDGGSYRAGTGGGGGASSLFGPGGNGGDGGAGNGSGAGGSGAGGDNATTPGAGGGGGGAGGVGSSSSGAGGNGGNGGNGRIIIAYLQPELEVP